MHVFISYKHEDLDFAENVMNRLKERGFQTWADHKIGAGEKNRKQSISWIFDSGLRRVEFLSAWGASCSPSHTASK